MTITAEQRSGLARAVSRLRHIFEEDLAALAEGKFGMYVSGRRAGHVVDSSGLSLSAHDLAARAELVGVIDYLQAEGLGAAEAVERMLREAVFTTVNRLLAIRVAEAIGVLPASLADGPSSEGFIEALEVFPLLREADASGGYWTYLQICGDELSHAVPRLFDRRHPLSALVPSAEALVNALDVLSDSECSEVWAEPEALGWSYQFFNTQEERRAMREASQAPRNSRELAVRNQFFTPGYVVRFLVQNTLGRRLRESGFELELPLLLGEIDRNAPTLDLSATSVMDPAVGSGHFLLGVYDLLERAWEERGVDPEEAAPQILNSLFGMEIDPRAAQVAQTVLYLRARRSAPMARLEPPAIVTARPLPKDPLVRAEVLSRIPSGIVDIVDGLDIVLDHAPSLGSLLKPEEYLRDAIGDRIERPRLGDDLPGTFEGVEDLVLGTASRIASDESSTPAERLFAADAEDALRFVELCARRYDVVLMNPPFGDCVPADRDFLRRAYPAAYMDLYAAFVARGHELLSTSGLMGAITSRTGLFLTSLETWRRTIWLPNVVSVVDLGMGVLEDALVEVAAYALCANGAGKRVDFARLIEADNKERAMEDLEWTLYPRVDRASFGSVPGAPVAYWIPESVRDIYSHSPRLEGSGAEVRQGLVTADDFRFVRAWWEVVSGGFDQSRWPPFAKGGEYAPYFADIHAVVDWGQDGASLREWGRGRVQNVEYYFKPGVEWPLRTKLFSPHVLPAGCIFSHNGGAMFPVASDSMKLLGWAASMPVDGLARVILERERFPRMMPGIVQRLPWPMDLPDSIGEVALEMWKLCASAWQPREESRMFVAPDVPVDRDGQSRFGELQRSIDGSVLGAYGNGPFADWMSGAKRDVPDYLMEPPGQELADRKVSYLVGLAFGRFDVRVGRHPSSTPPLPAPFDPLPVCPPGMLTDMDGLPSGESPADYPLELPPDRILYDDPGHRWDVVRVVETAAGILFEQPDRELQEALGHVKAKDLRAYLRGKFFPQHLRRYSKSRRKAPIYWYLSVPSKEWGLWVYAPWLSREQLFAVARGAQEKLRRLADEVGQARRDLETGGDRDVRERLEAAEELSREVAVFYGKADEVAQSGWEPDLNDGIILNAAPLEELFADVKWRKDVAKHRVKMQNGDYPWATVQTTYYDRQLS